MYDKLLDLLFPLGVDTSLATPQSTFRDLEMDSLSMTEFAVNAFTATGVLADSLSLDMTLAEAAEQFVLAAEPQGA